MTKTAKLFMNGRSQAVRLPKEFRFEGKEVTIRRDSVTGEVVLSEPAACKAKSLQDWFRLFDSLEIPEDFFKREVHMPVERDIF
ncbi:MAG: AbrB family transcriptional regulator [Terracidiphilus sp.]